MRCWTASKLGHEPSPNATISPSSTKSRPPAAAARPASSGYVPVTSLPVREYSVTEAAVTTAMARSPSHFIS